MNLFRKPIFTGMMPLLHTKEVALALSFFLPWKWGSIQMGPATEQVEQWIQNYFGTHSATCFDSGRSSLYFALKALDIQKGDEVLVQAYTCAVVSNAILFAGATPVYVDIKSDFTMDPEDLKKKITPRCKVLIVQHTFGIPSDIRALLSVAKQHHLKTIEDCAHVMGGKFESQLLGTFADIGMFSFGSEKPVSCGRGGALITNNTQLAEKIKTFQESLTPPPLGITLKQLFTFGVFAFTKPIYFWGGKFILALAKKFHFITRIIDESEKQGKNLPFYPAQLPNALAHILYKNLNSLGAWNTLRIQWSKQYIQTLSDTGYVPKCIQTGDIPLLRFPLLVPNPKTFLTFAKEQGVFLGDWYSSPIAPRDVSAERMGYHAGCCPMAESLATQSVNLPTHFSLTQSDFLRITDLVTTYARQKN